MKVAMYKALFRIQSVFACKKGENYVETGLRILIAVVIGALLLAGLYLLFNGTVMPTLTAKIKDLFNYKG
jgi:uncharacterized membrane protein